MGEAILLQSAGFAAGGGSASLNFQEYSITGNYGATGSVSTSGTPIVAISVGFANTSKMGIYTLVVDSVMKISWYVTSTGAYGSTLTGSISGTNFQTAITFSSHSMAYQFGPALYPMKIFSVET